MRLLLDTNVISELRKADRCDAHVAAWFDAVAEEDVYLSVLVIGEIRRGIESVRRRDPSSATALEAWLGAVVEGHDSRILPIDREIAETWGRFGVPDPVPAVDGMLAATAHVHGLTLATRNVRDVARTGVPCVDPFAAPRPEPLP